MNPVSNSADSQLNGFQLGLEGTGLVATNIDIFYRTSKVVYKFIDLVKVINETVSESLSYIRDQFSASAELLESLRFFSTMQMLCCPNDDGVYFFKNAANTWQYIADRVFLAAHLTFKMINAADKFGFIKLGGIAISSIGKLTLFKFVTDSLYSISCFFAVWDCSNKLKLLDKGLALANRKIEKWGHRADQVKNLKAGDQNEVELLRKTYNERVQKLSKDIAVLKQTKTADPAEAKETAKKVAKLQTALERKESRLAKLAAGDYQGVAEELSKHDAAKRLSKWEFKKATIHYNENLHWLKIASSVGKIAVISLAMTLTAVVGAYTAWGFAGQLAVSSLGLFSDSTGLAHPFYKKYAKPEAVSV